MSPSTGFRRSPRRRRRSLHSLKTRFGGRRSTNDSTRRVQAQSKALKRSGCLNYSLSHVVHDLTFAAADVNTESEYSCVHIVIHFLKKFQGCGVALQRNGRNVLNGPVRTSVYGRTGALSVAIIVAIPSRSSYLQTSNRSQRLRQISNKL